MGTFILIAVLSTSSQADSGMVKISQEFNTFASCKVAADNIAKQVIKNNDIVVSIGCYQK